MNPRGTITLMLLLVFALSVGLISRSPSGGASGMPDARGKNAAKQQYDHGGNGSSGGGGGGQRDSADGENPAGVVPAGPGLPREMVSMGSSTAAATAVTSTGRRAFPDTWAA